MPFGHVWVEFRLVALFCHSVCSLRVSLSSTNPAVSLRVCSSNTERKQHGTQPVLEHQLRKVHHKSDICLSFAPCFFPFFAVTCSAHCGLFWKVARDEHGTQYIAKNMCQHQHDLFLEVPWFQFLPRHSPGTNTEPNMVPALSPSCGTLSTRCNSRKTQHGSQPGLPKSVQKSKGSPLGGGGGSLAEILGECLES